MLPPVHELQLPHLTLAVIIPLLIPDPSSRDTSAASLYSGMTFPFPSRGESVTFWPSAEAYLWNFSCGSDDKITKEKD